MNLNFRKHNEFYFESLGINDVSKYLFVPENFITWNRDQDLTNIKNTIDTYSRHIILCFDSNPFSDYDKMHCRQYLVDLTQEFPKQVYLFSGDLNQFFDSNATEIYFPTFFIQQRETRFINHQTTNKKHRFSFLSNQVRFHRLWMYQQAKPYLTPEDCFAINGATYSSPGTNFIDLDCQRYLGSIQDCMLDVPYFSEGARDQWSIDFQTDSTVVDYHNQHPAYNACFNITGESSCDENQIFITEKTWKTIRSYCMPLLLGNPGTSAALAKLGFEIKYNNDSSIIAAVDNIVDCMKSWDSDTVQDIYHANQELLTYNYNRFYSTDLKLLFKNYIQQRLEIS